MSDYTKPYVVANRFAKAFFVPIQIDLTAFVNSVRTLTPAARLQRIEDIAERILNSRGNTGSGVIRNFDFGHVSGSTVFPHTMNTIFVHADAQATIGRHNEGIFVKDQERNIGFGSLQEGVLYQSPFSAMLSACIAYHLAKRVNASPDASERQKARAREAQANYVSQKEDLRAIPIGLLLYPESWIMKSGDNIYYSDGATPHLYLNSGLLDRSGFVDVPSVLRGRYAALRTEAAKTIAALLGRDLSGNQVLAFLTQQQSQHWSQTNPIMLKILDSDNYTYTHSRTKAHYLTAMLNAFSHFEDRVYQAAQGRELPGNATRKAFREKLVIGIRSALGQENWNFSGSQDITQLRTNLRAFSGLAATDEPLIQMELSRILGQVTYDWQTHEGTIPRGNAEALISRGASPSRWSAEFDHLSTVIVDNKRLVQFTPSPGNSVRLKVNGPAPSIVTVAAWTSANKRARLIAMLDAIRELIAVLAYVSAYPAEGENYFRHYGNKEIKVQMAFLRELVPASFVGAGHRLGSNV